MPTIIPELLLIAIILAYVTDLLLGDPMWLPHPIVGFGKMVAILEKRMNKGHGLIAKGLVMAVLSIVSVYLLTWTILQLAAMVGPIALVAVIAIGLFYTLANRTLINEGRMVFARLENEGVEAGRKQLARIVGRDTSNLSPQQIRTAVLETMAENLSDGVVAPLFWFAVGGLPAAMAYKMVNTLDSMVGYKNERYLYFGRAAARIDDVANFIPARITAMLMVLVALSWRGLSFVFRYGHRHASPNAGYPEAALAGILNVRFGGPNIYHGQLFDKPYIGHHPREITTADFRKTAYVNHAVCLVCVALVGAWYWLGP
jgi:adenosylcobinamide-phosphate synthase